MTFGHTFLNHLLHVVSYQASKQNLTLHHIPEKIFLQSPSPAHLTEVSDLSEPFELTNSHPVRTLDDIFLIIIHSRQELKRERESGRLLLLLNRKVRMPLSASLPQSDGKPDISTTIRNPFKQNWKLQQQQKSEEKGDGTNQSPSKTFSLADDPSSFRIHDIQPSLHPLKADSSRTPSLFLLSKYPHFNLSPISGFQGDFHFQSHCFRINPDFLFNVFLDLRSIEQVPPFPIYVAAAAELDFKDTISRSKESLN